MFIKTTQLLLIWSLPVVFMVAGNAAHAQNGMGQNQQNRGGSGQNKGGASETYEQVSVIEIFSKNGEKIFSYEAKSGQDATIEKVVRQNNLVKVVYSANQGNRKISEIVCSDCILRVDYTKNKQD